MSKSEALNRMRYKANQTNKTTQGSKTTQSSKTNQNYKKTERENQSARRAGSTSSKKGTITNSKGQKTSNQAKLTTGQMRNAMTGSASPMGHLRQATQAKSKGVTQVQMTQQAKQVLPQAVTKSLEKRRQQRVRELEQKLEKTTDRRARAAYRQELLETKSPLSQADRALPKAEQEKIWDAKRLWERGEQLKKQGQGKAGQAWQDYAHEAAESRRNAQGYTGGASGGDVTWPELTGKDRTLTDEGQKQLRSYKLYYDQGKRTGNRELMEAAQTAAQELRNTPGAWDPNKVAAVEKSYTDAAALLDQQARYERSGGRQGVKHTQKGIRQANQTVKELEAAYPELGRSARSRLGLTLRGAGENTLGSLAEAAGWILTPAEDGRNYRSRLTGDWVDPKPLEEAASEMYGKADKLLNQSNEDLTAAKFGLGKLGDVAVDVGAFGAQMVPEVALGAVTGGAGGLAAMGARAFGGGAHEARQAGGSYAQQGLYGLASAATEVATEKLFSVAAPFRRAYGSGAQVGGKSLDEMLVSALNRVTKNPEAARLVAAAGTEGLEEVIADAVNPVIRSIYNGQTPMQNYREEDVTNWLYDGMIGSILGGLGGVAGQAVNRRASTRQETAPVPPSLDQSVNPMPSPTLGEETLRRAAEEQVAGQQHTAERTPDTRTAAQKLAAYRASQQSQTDAKNTQRTAQTAPQQDTRTAAEKLAAYRASQQTAPKSQMADPAAAARQQLVQAGQQLGEHGQKALTAAYENGMNTADYFGGFSVLYEAGKAGKRAESVQSALVQTLTPAQKMAAYVAGQNDSKLTGPETGRTAGLVRTRAAETLDPVTAQRLDDLGKALDTPIHVREDTGAGVNGWYDRQLGRIVVTAGSEKSAMTVAKHEITHRMQDLAPREYAAYRDYAARVLGGAEGTQRLTAAYQERYAKAGVELSEEEALDEAAADFTEAMTENPSLFRTLAQAKPGPARKVVEAVKTFLRKIKAAFQGDYRRQDRAAAEAFGVTVQQLEKAAKLWEQALRASSGTAQKRKTIEAKHGNKKTRAPATEKVEESGENGEKQSLAGGNLLEAEARVKALEKENAILRERVDHFKNQMRRSEQPSVDRAEVRKQARALAKRYQATVSVDELAGRLQDLYDRMVQEKHMSWDVAYLEAKEIARDLAESAVTVNDGLYREYAELRNYLKKTPLRISEEESHDIPDYNDWRKHYLGKLRIGKGKTNIDQIYQELSQMWPEFFPQEGTDAAPVAPTDQLLHIANVTGDLYTITEENPYGGDMEQITNEIASDVMASFFAVPQTRKTFADRQQAKLEAEIAKGRARTRQAVEEERAARKREVKQIRDKYWDKRHEDLEKRTATELQGRILRHTKKLSQKLLRPTDKQHIPEEMRFAVAGVLDSINLTSAYVIDPDTGKRKKGDEGNPVKMTEKWLELKHAYETIQAERAGLDNWVIDPDLMENLNELAGLGNVPIMKMSRKQLVTVWNTLQAVEASILNQDKAFGKAKFATISQAAEALRVENRGKREQRNLRGPLGEVGADMMTPQAFFHRLGKTGDEIFRMLRSAQDEYITLLDSAQKKTAELLEENQAKVKQWEKETQTFTLKSGEKLTLTTAQMMSLYELMKRPQAREHVLLGGIRPENREKGLWDTTPAEPVQLDFGDCVQISLKLTEAQKNTADALQQYMAKDLAKEGNRASMEVYGYEKFGESHYFPILPDQNQVARDNAKEAKAQTIAGKGFTKGTVPKANNAVMLDSVFTVYANHTNEMLTYAAWLGPMENLRRLQNYVYRDEEGHRLGTVRAVIERVFGRMGNRYLNQLADDLNQGVQPSRSGNMFDRLTANYKVASVSANIRVFAQQPSAVLRALDQVNLGDFLLGLARAKPGTWKKVMTYAPIARWKDWGYFDVHTGRQVRNVLLDDDTAADRVKSALIAPAGTMDSLAWSGLWNALEAETRRKRRELDAGSTAFYQAVAARFNEVIDRTQVVDGVLQRSQFMRKPDSMSKMATSFMAEPTKTYNQFMSAVYDLRQAQRPKERIRAMRRMGQTCFALTASIVVNATVGRALIDALRDDDDDESYWEKYRQALTGLEGDEETLGEKIKGVVSGDLASDFMPWNYIPFLKDAASVLTGYQAKRMDMDSIYKFVQAAAAALKSLQGDGTLALGNAGLSLLAEAGRLLGVPVANIKRDIEAIYRTWLNGRGDLDGLYDLNKFLYAMNEKNAGRFMELAAKAKEQGNDALLDRIEADLRSAIPTMNAEDFDSKLLGKEKGKVEESEAYSQSKDKTLQPLLDHLAGSEAYEKLSDEQKEYIQKTLESYAKGVATYEASEGEITPSETVQKLMAVANAGLDVADFVTLKAVTKDLKSVKDPRTGETLEDSKSVLIRKAVEDTGIQLPEEQKVDVLELLGVNKKIRNMKDEWFTTYEIPKLEKQAKGEDPYAQLEKDAIAMDEMTASQRAAGSDDGTYHWSFPGARISSGFGPRNINVPGASRYHQGVDIPAAEGTNIGAARSGTVIFVGATNARGNYVDVQHDDGLVTRYQHCSQILVNQGDKVSQDQTIAKVGHTGVGSGPHLHLEVLKDGKAVDPTKYLGK